MGIAVGRNCCHPATARSRCARQQLTQLHSAQQSVHTTRVHGPSTRPVNTGSQKALLCNAFCRLSNCKSIAFCQHGPCTRVLGTHCPSTRAVITGVQNDTRVHGPCSCPVDTGSVYRALYILFARYDFVPIPLWHGGSMRSSESLLDDTFSFILWFRALSSVHITRVHGPCVIFDTRPVHMGTV